MSIEYLGQKFTGDLLEDGKIRSQETNIVFASPSAWAIACKRFINPDKKSGCGWASVKYKGKKLDVYKNIWYRRKKEEEKFPMYREDRIASGFAQEVIDFTKTMAHLPVQRMVVKHNTIANRTFTHDANTLIECVPFSNLGKIQPFLVTLSTNAALLMDFHCHLSKSEVSGYLAGHWDVNTHNLQITHAFPCRNTKSDRENAPQVESEISKSIDREKLTLVGWYHSHPFLPCAPSLRDIDAQLDYQIRMKGVSDNSYTPCIGFIVSPYNYENAALEILSNIIAYWVIPPPESKPNEYGRPMLMSYSVVQDALLSPFVKNEIKKCVDYYKKHSDFINFSERYNNASTYIDKLRTTLVSKFPREENETILWSHIREMLGCPSESKDTLLSIPTITKSSAMLPAMSASPNLNSNLMLPTDIASVLFNSGKFPSASSLLGLPDPMAHSTLAANNMFLSTNLFKMQELLKPLSTSSPLPITKSKSEKVSSPLKIPTDIKSSKIDFPTDINILNLKNKLEFGGYDLNLSKNSSKDFSASDLSISSVKSSKADFTVSDLSISSVKPTKLDYSLDLSRKEDIIEIAAKIPKTDYTSLDLSVPQTRNMPDTFSRMPSDLSVPGAEDFSVTSQTNDQPINLATD
ncbi:Restriction Enzyme Adenine Methylase Associated [Popillia japonica]|uniref:Restriction Enzyme Adenine Methylase Associated n=1 Tax=Popillia japonica TaxID=7064 RepID=A0AAW1IS32_POPJA